MLVCLCVLIVHCAVLIVEMVEERKKNKCWRQKAWTSLLRNLNKSQLAPPEEEKKPTPIKINHVSVIAVAFLSTN